jgi:hypothetical protein
MLSIADAGVDRRRRAFSVSRRAPVCAPACHAAEKIFPDRDGGRAELPFIPDAATTCLTPDCLRLEIRFVRGRHRGVLSGVPLDVLGAGIFRPLGHQRSQGTPVCHRRRPWHGENAFILDRKLELQPLALVVGVGCKGEIGSLQADVLSAAALFCFFCGLVVDQPISYRRSVRSRPPPASLPMLCRDWHAAKRSGP